MKQRSVIKPETVDSLRAVFDETVSTSRDDAQARRESLEAFLSRGFPTKWQEAWKYTDLSRLGDTQFVPPLAAEAPDSLTNLKGTDRITFINGQCVEGQTQAALDKAANPADKGDVYALNRALQSGGLRLQVEADNPLPRPLHIVNYRAGAADAATTSHLHHSIEIGENAEAEVILENCGAGHYFGTDVLTIKLAQGARLRLYRLQDAAAGATELASSFAEIGCDARLETYVVDTGHGLARQDLTAALCAPGAEAHIQTVSLSERRGHVDNHVRVEHRAPHGTSRIAFRGIASGRSRMVFNGMVHVDEGAIKTNSDQRLASLLLSPRAEVNAKPELEIYNDDVRCDHGSATGQLDLLALFYMRSRGLSEAKARELLTLSFVSDLLKKLPLECVRKLAEKRVTQRLRDMLAAPQLEERPS